MATTQSLTITFAVLASLVAVLYGPLSLRLEVLGITRKTFDAIHGEGFRIIADTQHCEDLHLHTSSGLIFGASEATDAVRSQWFPPTCNFNASAPGQGSIIVIDPETKSSKRLTLPNFSGSFITHGIDIWSPAEDPDSVYILAINHLPNPAYIASNGKIYPQARSQVELFHHTIGTSEAEHLRSIWHPLIRTPNDIYAKNAHAFYFTNDHYYRKGGMRLIEDGGFGLTPWSNIVYIEIADLRAKDASERVTATIAKDDIQNPNGFGHGKDEKEILICRAAAGVMEIAKAEPSNNLTLTNSIQFPNTIDNPTYFQDPYVKETGRDASGYVLAGLARAIDFPSPVDPVVVWLAQPSGATKGTETWVHTKIFQDDGTTLSTASTAVLVAINPKDNRGEKQAWLFITGPMSKGVAVSKVSL